MHTHSWNNNNMIIIITIIITNVSVHNHECRRSSWDLIQAMLNYWLLKDPDRRAEGQPLSLVCHAGEPTKLQLIVPRLVKLSVSQKDMNMEKGFRMVRSWQGRLEYTECIL